MEDNWEAILEYVLGWLMIQPEQEALNVVDECTTGN